MPTWLLVSSNCFENELFAVEGDSVQISMPKVDRPLVQIDNALQGLRSTYDDVARSH